MEELIPPPSAKDLLKEQVESAIDRQKFKTATEWLKGTIPNYDGQQLTIVEAYSKAFQFSIDQLEDKIDEARNKVEAIGLDPPLNHINQDVVNKEIENDELDEENRGALLDWFFQTYPRGHTKWYDVIKVMRNFMKQKPLPSLSDQIKHLRELYFNDSLPPSNFWKTLIENAYKDPKDEVKPLDALRKVKAIEQAKKLGLKHHKRGYVMQFDDSINFDKFLQYLPQEHKQRVDNYLLILNWLLTFPNWRKKCTLGQLARYQARNNNVDEPKSPWGEQITWQEIIRMRRLLDSWTINPPDVAFPYIETLDEEKLNDILKSDPEHILEKNRDMIPWFISVHNRAYELKNSKTKTAKKRTTPTESFENQPSQCEYATLYLPWITYRYSKFTILEAVEIAYFGRTHKIDPEMTTEQFKNGFMSLLTDFQSAKHEIKDFPKNLRWSKAVQDQILHRLQRNQPQYAKAYGIMYSIYLNQQDIIERNKWNEENRRRAGANQSSLTFDEWKKMPTGTNNSHQVSWFTGDRLPPGEWHMVPVENTHNENYRKIISLKAKMTREWKNTNSSDNNANTNGEAEATHKCSLCGKDGPANQFDTLKIHKDHHKAFYSYADRYKRKHTGEMVRETAQAPESPKEISVPHPGEEKTYKKKYEAISTAIKRWLDADLPDAKLGERLRAYVKRRKTENEETDREVEQQE